MNWIQLLRDKRAAIFARAAHHGASNLRVFGSVARGEAVQTSDLDLLVDMEKGRSLLDLVGLNQELEELLQCRVDVVTEADVSPYFRQRVLQEAIAL